MTAPRVDLSFDAYLKSQTGKGLSKQEQAPAQRQTPDLSYDAYLRQREPSTFERVSAGVLGVLDAPVRVLTQTGARLAGIGKSEETKRKYQAVIEKEFEKLGPKGKARETYETAAAVTSLPVEIAKYAGVAMIPYVGLPLAAAMGAGEAAGGLKEESSAALAKSLAERAGMQRTASALAPVVESGVGRAAFDVGMGEALALAVKGGTRGYRAVRGRQAAAEGAAEAAAPAAAAAAPPSPQTLLSPVPTMPPGAVAAPVTGPMVAQPSPLVAALETGAKKAGAKGKAVTKKTEPLDDAWAYVTPIFETLGNKKVAPEDLQETILEMRAALDEADVDGSLRASLSQHLDQQRSLAGRKKGRKLDEGAQREIAALEILLGEEAALPAVAAAETAATKRGARTVAEEAPVPMPPRQVGRPEQQTIVDFSGEAQVPATYRVVDARSLVPSHNPFTFQQSQRYPKEIQGRSYHTDEGARNAVIKKTMELRPEPLLDQTITAQFGAPIITPDGTVVAGNQRSMMLRRSIEFAPELYQQYANTLRANAEKFGLTADDFTGIEMPVLVREIDLQDTKTLAKFNRISDVSETKVKSGLDDAAARVATLREANTPLKHLASTLQPEETISDYLNRAEGKDFVKQLMDTGVIAPQEMSRYIADVEKNILNQEGKLLMQRIVLLSAIDDPEILSRAPIGIVQKLEGAVPHIVRSDFEGAPEFAIGSTIKQALELLTEAAARGIPLKQLAKQENLFAEVADPGVMQMAEFLGKATKTEITNRFRAYGAAAGDARVRAETGAVDMFGESIVTPEDARAALLSPPTPRAPKAKAVEEAIVPEAVAPSVVEAPVVAPEVTQPATQAVEALPKTKKIKGTGGNDGPAEYELVGDEFAGYRIYNIKGASGGWYMDSPVKGIQQINLAAWNKTDAIKSAVKQIRADRERGGVLVPTTGRLVPFEQPPGAPAIPPGPLKDPGALMGMAPQERNALLEQMDDAQLRSVEQYAREYLDDIFAKSGGQKPISEYKPAVQRQIRRGMGLLGSSGLARETRPERSGVIAPQTMNAIAGAGLGATAGATTGEDSELSPLQRALLYGAAGTAGGALVARRLMAAKPRVAPSIPELAPVAETINIGAREVGAKEPQILTGLQRLYNEAISETFVLKKVAERFGSVTEAAEMPGKIAQQQGARRAARGYLEDTLRPLIKDLTEAEKESVRSLMKARRDLQIRQKGGAAKSAVDSQTLQAAVAAGNANPKIATVADAITKMHRDLLEMRYQAGLLSQESYEAIKASDDYYTPFFRELADEAKATGTIPGARGGKMTVSSSGVRRMDRDAESLERTADPLETIIVDAARTYRDVGKQRVANVIFNIADRGDLPFIRRIEADPMNPPKREGIIQQKRDGKLYTYEVTDKDLFKVLAGQDEVSNRALVRFGRVLKDIKTAGITALPDFAIANVIRDVAASGLQRPDVGRAVREAAVGAGLGGGLGVATGDKETSAVKRFMIGAGLGAGAGLYARPLLETMGAMKAIVKNDQLFRDFLADGASTEGFYIKDANDAAKALKQLERDPRKLEEIVKSIVIPTNWLETLRRIGSVAEQSTRLAAYRQMKEAGFSGAEAALAAQDRTLRFANIGANANIKDAASMVPFWNAKVQGWDKLARMLKEKKTWGLAAGMMTAPSLALWSVNKDNPEYWERPTWEKNMFWLIPKSFVGEEGEKGFYRIPKPFELGFMFASLPERLADYAAQAGVDFVPDFIMPGDQSISSATPVVAEPGRALSRAAGDIRTQMFEGVAPVPEFVSLPAQIAANRDYFRNRPIVTRPQLSPEFQVTDESSTIARALAKAGVSPEQTDFTIRSLFGTAGSEISKAIDIGARAVGLNAPPPPAGTTRIPVVGRFEERFTTSTKGQTDPEAMARERLRELNQVRTDLNELRRTKDTARLQTFVDEHLDDLRLLQQIQPIETELEKISRLRTQVRKAPGLTPDQRQGALEILRERGQSLSETLIGVPRR